MSSSKALVVEQIPVVVVSHNATDYISLADMVRTSENGSAIIENWLRNKNTLEFLTVWEEIYNPCFNSIEFEGTKKEAGLNPDHATVAQMVVLSNLESINAELIRQGVAQPARITALNQTAVHQLRSLLDAPEIKKLK